MINLRMRIIDQQLHKFILTMPACKPHLKVSLPEDGRFEISTHAHTAGMAVKVKSVPGKISVRLCGMFNRAGQREVVKKSFTNRRKGFLPAGCGQEIRAEVETKN